MTENNDTMELKNKMYTEEGMTLINLTPHDVNIRAPGGEIVLPPSGRVLRVQEETVLVGRIAGLPVARKNLTGLVEDPPPTIPGVRYIVSSIVAQALPEREDFLIPSPVRDGDGRVIGTRGFYIIGRQGRKGKGKGREK